MTASERSDEELRQLAIGGDREAQDELESRFLPSLYDFALRTSLDPHVAEEAARLTLRRVVAGEQRAGGLSLTAWALGGVRDEALERLRARGNGSDSRTPISPVDPMFSELPAGVPGADAELAGWVWQAARSQRPRDYSLLDLSVRRGVSADEIAEATEMSHSGIYAILGRLRGFFEETFTSTLLYHRGRDACQEVARLATGSLGPAVRREIARHVETCAACRQTRRSHPSPAELLAAFRQVDVPPSVSGAAEATRDVNGAVEPPAEARPQGALPLVAATVGGALAGATEAESAGAGQVDAGPVGEVISGGPDAGEGLEDGSLAADEPQTALAVSEAVPVASEAAPSEPEVVSSDDAAAEAEEPLMEDGQYDERAVESAPPESVLDGESEEAEHVEAKEEDFDIPESRVLVPAGGSGAVAAADSRALSLPEERLRARRDYFLSGLGGASPPPRRPWDGLKGWFEEQGPARVSFMILFVGALALAVYLGLALGDSIEGGSSGNAGGGLAALPTTTPGVRQIGCGSGTYTIDQGIAYNLAFDSTALPGYTIGNPRVTPISATALAQSLDVTLKPPHAMEVTARTIPGSAGRTDEYRVAVSFNRSGEREVTAECTILVRGVADTPVPTAPPASATPLPPTATPTRPPSTAVPATQTPLPPTAAPPTDTPPPSNTPTRTPTPTQTRTPTATIPF